MKPKVLVAAPTYEGKHYMFPYWYKNITNLTYPNYDWLVVDNSRMQSYLVKLRREGYKKIHGVPRGGNTRLAIGRASEYIRQYAIKNKFDYIMFIETDLLPPRNIIEILLSHEKEVVGAAYEVGLKGSKDAPRRPLIYYVDANQETGTESLQILPVEEGYKRLGTGLIPTPAMGLGCCLIHKNIFTKYPFKYHSTAKLHTDVLFYFELWQDEVPVYVDTNLLIPHYNQNWADVKDW